MGNLGKENQILSVEGSRTVIRVRSVEDINANGFVSVPRSDRPTTNARHSLQEGITGR